jgi:hypothetical protein
LGSRLRRTCLAFEVREADLFQRDGPAHVHRLGRITLAEINRRKRALGAREIGVVPLFPRPEIPGQFAVE